MFHGMFYAMPDLIISMFCIIPFYFGLSLVNPSASAPLVQGNFDQWTHIKGPRRITGIPGYQALDQVSIIDGEFHESNTPLQREDFVSVYHNGSVVICGGDYDDSQSMFFPNDVWEYSVALNSWRRLKEAPGVAQVVVGAIGIFNESNSFENRYGFAGWITEDQMGVWGGWNSDLVEFRSESWFFSLALRMWKKIDNFTNSLELGEDKIGGRQNFGQEQIEDDCVVVIGGVGYLTTAAFGHIDDIWTMNLTDYRWLKRISYGFLSTPVFGQTNVYHSSNTPGSKWMCSTALNSLNGRELYLIGGELDCYGCGRTDHVFQLNISSWEWRFVSGSQTIDPVPIVGIRNIYGENNTVGAKSRHRSVYVNDEIYVFGGMQLLAAPAVDGFMSDIWAFDVNRRMWKFISRSTQQFPSRHPNYGTSEVYSSENHPGSLRLYGMLLVNNNTEILIMMGRGHTDTIPGVLSDIWKLELLPRCFGIISSHSGVCSSHGICVDYMCQCHEGYFGVDCSISQCYGIFSNFTSGVCSGSGACLDGACACYSSTAYTLDNCTFDQARKEYEEALEREKERQKEEEERLEEERLQEQALLIERIILIVSISLGGVVACLFICVGLFTFIFVVSSMCKKVKKFDQLDEVELLLEEQKMNKNTSIPKHRINKNLFSVDPKSIKIGKKLGQGGGGAVVYSAVWNKQRIAYKCFQVNDFLDGDKYKEFEKELEILSSISFPFILIFYGATLSETRLGILMELCENGDLTCFLAGRKGAYPTRSKLRMLYEIASAMGFLHGKQIMHRDLKPENVLVTMEERCKLMDFGLSKFDENDNNTKTRRVGTSIYMAPEVLSGDYSYSCDVFSFSVVCYVILTENWFPYGKNVFRIENQVANKRLRPSFVGFPVSKKLQKFCSQNWHQNPKERMKFDEISSFFSKWNTVEFSLPSLKSRERKGKLSIATVEEQSIAEQNKEILSLKKVIGEKDDLIEEQKRIIELMKKKMTE